jgi:hypothetical protein
MTVEVVNVSSLEDIEAILNKATTEGTNLLLLYDDRIDKVLHKFLVKFARSDERFSILISGKKVRTIEKFYKEVRYSIPDAGYMGSNLDALTDVLRNEGLSDTSEEDVYWIWERSHFLFDKDIESFRSVYWVMAEDAREVRSGYVDANGNKVAPWPDWSPKRVILILTGRSDIMLSEASRQESFFFRFPDSEFPDSDMMMFPDQSTQTVAYHLK